MYWIDEVFVMFHNAVQILCESCWPKLKMFSWNMHKENIIKLQALSIFRLLVVKFVLWARVIDGGEVFPLKQTNKKTKRVLKPCEGEC